MSTFNSLNKVYKSSKVININDSSKIILMSDIHRGNNSWSDDFAHNQNLFFTALNHYYNKGFTYVELGDGDELWENRSFQEIRKTHSHVFDLLHKYYIDNRLHFIYGNHDMVKKREKFAKKNLYSYYDERKEKYIPLFKDIKCEEGIVLNYLNKENIFLVHGHQGDLLNDKLWWLARFLVRYVWKPIELYLGFKDTTSPAKNFKKKKLTERKITRWARINNTMVISGHTHRPVFANINEPLYFNTGSGVHPRCITGIEIEKGEISLIKWSIRTKDDGVLYVTREIIVGPENLNSFFNRKK